DRAFIFHAKNNAAHNSRNNFLNPIDLADLIDGFQWDRNPSPELISAYVQVGAKTYGGARLVFDAFGKGQPDQEGQQQNHDAGRGNHTAKGMEQDGRQPRSGDLKEVAHGRFRGQESGVRRQESGVRG